jgi:hypothetical protein
MEALKEVVKKNNIPMDLSPFTSSFDLSSKGHVISNFSFSFDATNSFYLNEWILHLGHIITWLKIKPYLCS